MGTGAAGSPPGGHLLSPHTTGLSRGRPDMPRRARAHPVRSLPPHRHPPPSYNTLDALTLTLSLSALLTPGAGRRLSPWLLRVVWVCRWALPRAPVLPQA